MSRDGQLFFFEVIKQIRWPTLWQSLSLIKFGSKRSHTDWLALPLEFDDYYLRTVDDNEFVTYCKFVHFVNRVLLTRLVSIYMMHDARARLTRAVCLDIIIFGITF